ncbi:ABC transporter ATP-binding protein [Deinococcus arenae]|uniref:ABC transporter ATP-binding protein n=2 Tax=Deinococcus TaxID=1298 RepID=A0A8H9GL48_9DEIO|nr:MULTISPECIES: ATP-binding cassette domain-containing protein [Deinococcus]ALW89004.1 ABC transporter ATP-binding protein [Deinococcus actinosclerus]AWT35789.1 ABC transporter ATP-binding protein [Deinococcus actinosclerus]GGM31787.1 ABC transporter ATP-binding protein [Deinococcus arenae]
MLDIQNVTKTYGRYQALTGITLQARGGEVFGLLGPNGAGKTTLLRILATLLRPTAGTATLGGHDILRDPEGVRRSVGVVNGGMGLPARLTGREVLRSFATLYGLSRPQADARIAELDDRLELGRTLDVRAGEYSTGMKQKVVIARAVIHDPPVLILDEAASGLDIFARRTLLDFVHATRAPGRLTVYSTHVMSEVEEVCDRVAILHEGHLLNVSTIPEVLARTGASSLERAFFRLVRPEAPHAR